MPEGLRADLQQQIAGGDCLLVVGAGVAIFGTGNAPCASWNGLLRQRYGVGYWRKKKGIATVRLLDGTTARAELHWYEAHGIGKVKLKIKEWL